MNAPLMTLPCIGARLELYRDRVVLQRTGWLARLLQTPDQTIRVNEIKSLRIFQDHPLLNGMLVIRAGQGRAAYVVYAQNYFRAANNFYLALDDLITRKDVLGVVRTMQAT